MNEKRNEILKSIEDEKSDSPNKELSEQRKATQTILFEYLFYYKRMRELDANADLAKRANLQS